MAVLDLERGVLVVRIVYDGTPEAGKTTSLRALGHSLKRSVHTPLEAAGRTVFFDWMEYTGGLFEGHQICCQIVSVPGQLNLAPRRRALLLSADAVIFVADTGSRAGVERSSEYLAALARVLRTSADPPVGVVFQANKRDLEAAVPLAELRRLLGVEVSRGSMMESIAHEGVGVRETFVFAVRLALDRVRELIARGQLPQGPPAIDSAEALLRELETSAPVLEGPPESGGEPRLVPGEAEHPGVAEPTEAAPFIPAVAVSVPAPVTARTSAGTAPPNVPDNRVPGGAIWPAVDGRIVLHEATSSELVVRRGQNEAWVAGIGTDWRLHTEASSWFPDLDRGRRALVEWARLHAASVDFLSGDRCIVVADDGAGGWRLWQILKRRSSLRDALADLSRSADVESLAAALVDAAARLFDALENPGSIGLLVTFESLGMGERGVEFLGLMPMAHAVTRARSALAPAESALDQVLRQVDQLLANDIWDRADDLGEWARGEPSAPADAGLRRGIVELLRSRGSPWGVASREHRR